MSTDPANTRAAIYTAGETVNVGLRVAGWGFAAWCGKEALVALAGQTTEANIAVRAMVEISAFKELVPWILFALAVVIVVVQRRLHGQTIERLTTRTTELEVRLDPSRTSSGLAPDGTTPKEDRG